jgi:hypothetical protein
VLLLSSLSLLWLRINVAHRLPPVVDETKLSLCVIYCPPSMGVGEFLSSKANNEWILNEKKREEWELENYREGEIQEMVDIYVSKGLSPEDAKLVIETMAKYDDFFVDIMMQQELELQVPEENHLQESMKEGRSTHVCRSFGDLGRSSVDGTLSDKQSILTHFCS